MQWTDRIGRRIKLRDLHILMAVAQFGSMARAADHLAISHPVVSKTISDLEHALGVRLLDRTPQGVEPTAYGRTFLNCGTVVFDELRRGVQQIELLSDPTVGEVCVGGTGPMIDGLFPTVIDSLTRRYPRIVSHAIEGTSPVLYRMLRERTIDLAVSRVWRPEMAGGDFATEFLFDEHLFVVAGSHSRWARRRKMNLDDLLQDPWIMPEWDNAVGVLINQGFQSAGIPLPAGAVIANSMSVRTRLAETGRFLTMLPGSMLYFGGGRRAALKILPVKLPMQSQPVEIITLKQRTPNAVAKLVIEELRAVTEPLRKSAAPQSKR